MTASKTSHVLCALISIGAGAAFAAAEPTPAAAGRRKITETDLLKFVWVADPQISPDGERVAFVRVTVDEKRDSYANSIWIVPADASEPARPFTSGSSNDSGPRWSPNGRSIAFVRSTLKDGKPQPGQIWMIPTSGGEARPITDLPRGAGSAVWSPDGTKLAFITETTGEDIEKAKTAKERPGDEPAKESDVRVIVEAVYRFNGAGYLDTKRKDHIWVVDVPLPGAPLAEPKPVTSGSFDERSPAWSADGKRIFFASERVKEPYYHRGGADVWAVALAGGEPTLVASIDGDIGSYAVGPEGSRLAFQGSLENQAVRSYDQTDLFVTDVSGGAAPRNLTKEFDNEVGDGIIGDQRPPRGANPAEPAWTGDGKSVVILTAEKGRSNLTRVDLASGKREAITSGDHDVISFTTTPDGRHLAFVMATPTALGELHVIDTTGSSRNSPRRLTDFNAALFSQLQLTPPEEITWKSFDGQTIHSLVQKPPDYTPGKAYPTILNIHGGPHAAYGYTFFHEMQWMAAKGYVVLYPNPRGSTTYGQDFANVIQYAYPGDDYKDLMAGVDELVKQGLADEKRLGVTGGSGGGVLTNHTVVQTNRFAAAVSQRSISDWSAWWYTADFTMFQPRWFRGAPFEKPQEFASRSAITFADRIRTPIMFIEGETDLRTPPTAGGEQLFRALKYLKRPTVMVQFPGETHELSRSGQPSHRLERLRHIMAWFDKYLIGVQTKAYEIR